MWSDLAIVFGIGFVGSVHCMGMCGGFAMTLAHRGGRAHLSYFGGKTLAYAVLGAIVGGAGAVIGHTFSGMQGVLSGVLGALLVLVGLGLLGAFRRVRIPDTWKPTRWMAPALAFFVRDRSGYGALGLGFLNGFLPCGLVYAALVKAAATGSIVTGAITMAVFGVATIPALAAVSLTTRLLQPVWRRRVNVLAGLLVVALGLLTIARGTPLMDTGSHGQHDAAQHVGG